MLVSIMAIALCGSVALALTRSPSGQISAINHLAPIILPLGFHIGRGKLPPIVVCSSVGWITVGSLAAIHAVTGFQIIRPSDGHHSWVLSGLMILSVLVDCILFVFLSTLATKNLSLKSPGLKPMMTVLSILAATVFAAILLWNLGWPASATVLAGAPPILVGGFYTSLFLVSYNRRFN
jgi:hypothetical protein